MTRQDTQTLGSGLPSERRHSHPERPKRPKSTSWMGCHSFAPASTPQPEWNTLLLRVLTVTTTNSPLVLSTPSTSTSPSPLCRALGPAFS